MKMGRDILHDSLHVTVGRSRKKDAVERDSAMEDESVVKRVGELTPPRTSLSTSFIRAEAEKLGDEESEVGRATSTRGHERAKESWDVDIGKMARERNEC